MKRLLLVLAAVLALVATSCGSNGSTGDGAAAATVNGSVITIDQLNAELEVQADLLVQTQVLQGYTEEDVRGQIEGATSTSYSSTFTASVLSQMIANQLLQDEADARGVTPSAQDTQAAEQAIEQQYQGVDIDPELKDQLVQRYSTVSALNTALKDEFPAPETTEEDVRAAYDESIDGLVAQYGDFACIDLIGIGWTDDFTATTPTPDQESAALATAEDVVDQLDSGASFEDMVDEFSDHAPSKADGGNYGCLPQGSFPIAEIDTAAFSQDIGEISAPIRSEEYGYLIVRVRSRGVPSFEDVEPVIRAQVEQQASQNSTPINNWYNATIKDISVDVNPQIGSWSATDGVVPPEGAATQSPTPGQLADLAEQIGIDPSQLTGSGSSAG